MSHEEIEIADTNYIFDEETINYLTETMLNTDSYHSESYDFNLQPKVFKNIKTTITNYTENIKQWTNQRCSYSGKTTK